jgi:hypothetical protein
MSVSASVDGWAGEDTAGTFDGLSGAVGEGEDPRAVLGARHVRDAAPGWSGCTVGTGRTLGAGDGGVLASRASRSGRACLTGRSGRAGHGGVGASWPGWTPLALGSGRPVLTVDPVPTIGTVDAVAAVGTGRTGLTLRPCDARLALRPRRAVLAGCAVDTCGATLTRGAPRPGQATLTRRTGLARCALLATLAAEATLPDLTARTLLTAWTLHSLRHDGLGDGRLPEQLEATVRLSQRLALLGHGLVQLGTVV